MDGLVAAYLRTRGFKDTLNQLKRECDLKDPSMDPQIAETPALSNEQQLYKQSLNILLDSKKKLLKNIFNYTNQGSTNPQSYIDSFKLFVEWSNQCLDCYRV